MKDEYLYSPTDLDDELFLSEVPLEILQESIETQFSNPLEYKRKDYVQSFITKYEFSKENMMEEDLTLLEFNRDKFINFMENIFEKYLSIGFNDLDNLDEEEQHEILHQTYRFFIKNIKKNFVNTVHNYIEENKDELVTRYEKKKDVTTMNFKTEIDDENDITIIANLSQIIFDIVEYLKNLSDIDEFFKLCQCDEVILELECVSHYYDAMILTGNFLEKYILMINDDFYREIQSKIRNRILKKYPYREMKNEENENEE